MAIKWGTHTHIRNASQCILRHASPMVMMVAAVPVDAAVDSSAVHTEADPDSHTAV